MAHKGICGMPPRRKSSIMQVAVRPRRVSEQLPTGRELRRSKRVLLQLPIQVR